MFNKILLTIFGLLLIIVVVESLFYFSSTNRSKALIQTPKPIQVATKGNIVNQARFLNTKENTTNSAPSLRYFLRKFDVGILKSGSVTSEYSGKITKFEKKRGIVPNTTFEYQVLIDIATSKNPTARSFYLNEKDLKLVKIINEDDKKNIELSNLKINDSITIIQIIDLTKEPANNLIEFKIIKSITSEEKN